MRLDLMRVVEKLAARLTIGRRRRSAIWSCRLSLRRIEDGCRLSLRGGVRHLPLPRLAVSRETFLVKAFASHFAFFGFIAIFIVVKAEAGIVVGFRLWLRGWSSGV